MSIAEEEITAWGPRDYVPIDVHPDWIMADIGPGRYPHPRADVHIEVDPANIKRLLEEGRNAVFGDLDEGLPEIEDKEFDYVWASHVLEHAKPDMLEKWAATLSRISKRGTIVMPSFAKESLFHFEEQDHRWLVLPSANAYEPPIFVEQNVGFLQRLRDQMIQKATCFLYRTGTAHDCTTERYMRTWYQDHEQHLDVIWHWEGELKLRILR